MTRIIKTLTTAMLVLAMRATQASASSIVAISIPPDSQANSAPKIANVYSAVAAGGVLDTAAGVGLCVNPVWVSANVQSDFCLHQNQSLGSPAPYVGPYVPDPSDSTVHFVFDNRTIVTGVAIVEHFNGATGVSGALGDSLDALQPLGSAFTSSIGLDDGVVRYFLFGNTTVAGHACAN